MFEVLIRASVSHKLLVGLLVLAVLGFGGYAASQLPVGAVPDVTNNQVQVITTSRNLAAEDIEQYVTAPVELAMANLPGVQEIRSVSKFGLSVVTIVFDDALGTYLPRQLISEKLADAAAQIPAEFGSPGMGPITTGLGEIYQYVLDVDPAFAARYSLAELRTIQDWIVRRQLAGIPGVVEVNTWGGDLKTYEVQLDPARLRELGLSIAEVFRAVNANNALAGGGYIERGEQSYFVRAQGVTASLSDIEGVVVANRGGTPIYVRDVATVGFGAATRFGAITANGEGEKVLGQVMMLKGANADEVIEAVKTRVAELQTVLPEGVSINPFLERSGLIERTTATISENLALGCLIVTLVVVLLLGDWRAGLVVASVIPLCLLFAVSLMYVFGVDANLMSLGAIDFGIIIDGAVIIVEFIAFRIATAHLHNDASDRLTADEIAVSAASTMMRSAVFGQLIIVIVFIPILTLRGVEGAMFRPMALVFCFALLGAMLLCFTYVPVMAALFIRPHSSFLSRLSAKLTAALQRGYRPAIGLALRAKPVVLLTAAVLLAAAGWLYTRLGAEFIPTLDEGDFVIQPVLKTGMSLEATVATTTHLERILRRFPEVRQVVSRIGAAEVPTDPMSMEESDVIITLLPKSEWTSSLASGARITSKDQLAEAFSAAIAAEIPNVEIEYTQPIEMRFNELITGVRADLAIKIFGEDLDVLARKGAEVRDAIADIPGAADISLDKTAGLPQLIVRYRRDQLAAYGLNVADLNELVSIAFAGVSAGRVFEGERQFDLVVKFAADARTGLEDLRQTPVLLPDGSQLPLDALAEVTYAKGPALISRDDAKRRVVVGVNVRGRDLQSVVDDARARIAERVQLPPGYAIAYGGQFENLQSATARLAVAVPVSLLLIFVLLYFAFGSLVETAIVYTAIPLAAVGGVFLLGLRGMPFSISAGVGFIALFGIAVLNGIVLVEHFNHLKAAGVTDVRERVIRGTSERLRPVLLTALAAALGFLPMAVSTSAGAEVQAPLATVVIGGLLTAALLTLFVLPTLYALTEEGWSGLRMGGKSSGLRQNKLTAALLLGLLGGSGAATPAGAQDSTVSLPAVLDLALANNARLAATRTGALAEQARVGSAVALPQPSLNYGFDANNLTLSGDPLHVLGVHQRLRLPRVYRAELARLRAVSTLAGASLALEVDVLSRRVSLAYAEVLHQRRTAVYYAQVDSLLRAVAAKAERSFGLGEASGVERLTARAAALTAATKLARARAELVVTRTALEALVQADLPRLSDGLELPTRADSVPTLTLLAGSSEVSRSELGVVALVNSPEFELGVFNGFDPAAGKQFYPGVQVGVGLPVWRRAGRARSQAAELDARSRTELLAAERARLGYEGAVLRKRYELAAEVLARYDREGTDLQREVLRVASGAQLGGEIDFLQYARLLEQAQALQLDYLEARREAERAAVELQYRGTETFVRP